jgi:phosphatidylglycerophosphatase C
VTRQTIIASDVDGTLTWADSFHLFARMFGRRGAIPSPAAIAAFGAEGGPFRDRVKAAFWAAKFANMPDNAYRARAEWFGTEVMPKLVRPDARRRMEELRDAGSRIIPVTASCEDWMIPWAEVEGLGTTVIATQAERHNGRLSGRLIGRNCRGSEKVRRWNKTMNGLRPDEAWGDTGGDRPLLAIASTGRYKPFREAPFSDEQRALLDDLMGKASATFQPA